MITYNIHVVMDNSIVGNEPMKERDINLFREFLLTALRFAGFTIEGLAFIFVDEDRS